jgi:hypothetical protein
VTFAQHFSKEPGLFGERDVPEGCYEISASRNAVIVHKCELRGEEAVKEFCEAINQAFQMYQQLSRSGY